MPSRCADSPAVPRGVAAYSGSYPIDHLEEAIVQGDDAVARHFFAGLLPRAETHETIARILCRRNASTLLTELLLAGYWPTVDVVRELLSICAASASCHAMNQLLELAADRGIVCDALATGWVNALAGEAGTGHMIQRINQWFPGSVGIQAAARALEAAHPETLQAVLTCLNGDDMSEEGSPSELEHSIGLLTHDCLETLTAGTAAVLLANGLDPKLKSSDGNTLLERIFQSSTTEVHGVFQRWIDTLSDGKAMSLFVLIGDDVSFVKRCRSVSEDSLVGFDAQAALATALSRNHVALARVLLTMGADVNGTSTVALTSESLPLPAPLFIAIESEATACVQLLLKANADPDVIRQSDGASCLTLASLKGHYQLVCEILQAGADVMRFDGHGNTALHYCAVRGDIDLCARLLRAGALINAQDLKHGHTALSLACLLGRHRENHDVIGFLVDMGASLEAQDALDRSPLELASMTSQTELVNTLMQHGADGNGMRRKLMPGRLEEIERVIPGIRNFTGVKGIAGFKNIALRMISLVERSTSPEPVRPPDSTANIEAWRDYDQAA